MKLSEGSKDQIIDFLELSDKMPDLKNIYSKLLIHNLFLRKLKEIKYLLNSRYYNCSIINQSPNKQLIASFNFWRIRSLIPCI